MRRNSRYRSLHAEAGHGGLDAELQSRLKACSLQDVADPDRPASSAKPFWRPEAAPAVVVILEAAGQDHPQALHLQAEAWPKLRLGQDLQLRAPGGLQVLVRGARLDAPMAAVLPLGADFQTRLRTLTRFRSSLLIPSAAPDLTDQQTRRLGRALQAFDGWAAGLTYRELADWLFPMDSLAIEPWKTSSMRDATIRLVRTGLDMVRGGYRNLLRRRPR